jgi:hypothetical protein
MAMILNVVRKSTQKSWIKGESAPQNVRCGRVVWDFSMNLYLPKKGVLSPYASFPARGSYERLRTSSHHAFVVVDLDASV